MLSPLFAGSALLLLAGATTPTLPARPGFEARTDGHESEDPFELARPELEGFMLALSGSRSADDINRYLSPNFAGVTPLVPARLETVLEGDGLTVRHARSLPTERSTRDHLEEYLADLVEPFGPPDADHPIHAEAKIYTTERDARRSYRFTTSALVHLDGPAQAGGHFQINMVWRLGWEILTPETGTIARIRSIELEHYEDLHARRAFFADVTLDTLASSPRFAEDFERGAGQSHFRTDTLNGNEFVGQSGIAIGDANGDGLEDVFVPQPGGLPNRLLLHRPDGTVEDASQSSGLDILDPTQSALFLDLDNDGDQDLAIASETRLWIARNDGASHFSFDAPALRLPDAGGMIQSLAAADWDGDGDLDLYACVYDEDGPLEAIPRPYFDAVNGPPNAAWRNDGEEGFSEVTSEIGLDQDNRRFSHAALFEDFDADGDPDLYVVNDFGANNLYRNDGGHFTEIAEAAGAANLGAGMGVSAGDVDRDGDVDLFVANTWSSAGNRIISQLGVSGPRDVKRREEYARYAQGTSLLLNRGDGTFTEADLPEETRDAGWNFGSMLLDINNDGALDIYAPNGFLTGPVRDDL
ncbi:MAG TPA: VCBS repeat-containing protein [Planctomycetes bacterium]|nr:VCBS repeat-containing protein [Planctomycetota bacterium]